MGNSDNIHKSKYDAILRIVSEEKISRQEIIIERLRELGYNTTQSTLSRDMKKLGIIKASGSDGIIRYMVSAVRFADKSIFKAGVTSADYAGHTAVIKCRTGTAQAVCATLDTMDYSDIVGTLAGDDTIFILMRTENDAKRIVMKLRKELELDD